MKRIEIEIDDSLTVEKNIYNIMSEVKRKTDNYLFYFELRNEFFEIVEDFKFELRTEPYYWDNHDLYAVLIKYKSKLDILFVLDENSSDGREHWTVDDFYNDEYDEDEDYEDDEYENYTIL